MVFSSSMGQFNDCEPSLIDNIKCAGLHWMYKQMLSRGIKDDCEEPVNQQLSSLEVGEDNTRL